MKVNLLLWCIVLVTPVAVVLARPTRAVALTDDAPSATPSTGVELPAMQQALPEPGRNMRLVEYLYRGAQEMADAYADRHENAYWREVRLRALAGEIADAAELVGSQGVDWKYADTLLCIGHRETRFARNPRTIGTEDNGRAAGPWQIWGNRYGSPFRAATAMAMLLAEASSWSLPQKEPWTGYPACAQWIEEHPFQ